MMSLQQLIDYFTRYAQNRFSSYRTPAADWEDIRQEVILAVIETYRRYGDDLPKIMLRVQGSVKHLLTQTHLPFSLKNSRGYSLFKDKFQKNQFLFEKMRASTDPAEEVELKDLLETCDPHNIIREQVFNHKSIADIARERGLDYYVVYTLAQQAKKDLAKVINQ